MMNRRVYLKFSALLLCCTTLSLIIVDAGLAQDLKESWEGAYTAEPFANGEIREVYCDLVGLLEGQLGALILMAAGVAALIAAALGNLRHSSSAVIVAVSLATISTGVSVYFGDFNCPAPRPETDAGIFVPPAGIPGALDPAGLARAQSGFPAFTQGTFGESTLSVEDDYEEPGFQDAISEIADTF